MSVSGFFSKMVSRAKIFFHGTDKKRTRVSYHWERYYPLMVKEIPKMMIPIAQRNEASEVYAHFNGKRLLYAKNRRYKELDKKIGGGVFSTLKHDHANKF